MRGGSRPTRWKGSHLIIRILAFHGKEAAIVRQQVATPGHQVIQGGKRTAADLAIWLFRLAVFGTAMDNIHVFEAQLQYTLIQKAGFLAVAVQQGEARFRHHNSQRSSRQATAGTHIEKMFRGYPRQNTEAVEQLSGNHLPLVAHSREVVCLVPLVKQSKKCQQLLLLVVIEGELHVPQPFPELALPESLSHGSIQALCLRNNSRFFRFTRICEIAAGVTPWIRDAWATVSGRTSFSFCLISFDSPPMAS